VGIVLTLLLLAMVLPTSRNQEKTLSTEATAEELVARLRRARETARTKGVPVGVCIPKNATTAYSDSAFQMEGDINPTVTSRWKIGQKFHETVLFTGEWAGLSWTDGTTANNSSYRFDLNDWWTSSAPPLQCYVFLPTGEAVSSARLGGGEYRIVVAQGLVPSSMLTQATNAWTVSISPNGETSLEKGVVGGVGVLSTGRTETPQGATYTVPDSSSNVAPVKAGPGDVGVFAFPDTDNPNGSGKIVDLHGMLTLEVRVRDEDGDPPYFQWSVKDARSPAPAQASYGDVETWGGRFSNTGEVRMEWDGERKEWVGRTTWTPAPGDRGGNSYQLQCLVRDRRGGTLKAGFPITGWLETTKEQWVLYRTVGPSGRWELWKMTLRGLNHKRVVAFEGRDVIFGEWGPSGDEVIVAGDHGVFRASADGGNLKKISRVNVTPPATAYGIIGVSITPRGDRALYTVGNGRENYDIREITLNAGTEVDRKLVDYAGVIDWIEGLKVTEINNELWAVSTFHRRYKVGFNNRNRKGVLVKNITTGKRSKTDDPGGHFIDGDYKKLTISFAGYDSHTQIVWADMGQEIHVEDITVGPPLNSNLLTRTPIAGSPFRPGQNEISYPRLTFDGKGCVYTSGTGSDSEIWYIEDIVARTPARRLTLSPLNTGGRDVSISIPR